MARSIHNAAIIKLNEFEDLYVDSMEWLRETLNEAFRLFGNESKGLVLLPRTPSVKRKYAKINVEKDDQVLASTFHDGGSNKKMKIDNLSTILDSSINANDTGETTVKRKGKRGRAKPSAEPVRRSTRLKSSLRTNVETQENATVGYIRNINLDVHKTPENKTVEVTDCFNGKASTLTSISGDILAKDSPRTPVNVQGIVRDFNDMANLKYAGKVNESPQPENAKKAPVSENIETSKMENPCEEIDDCENKNTDGSEETTDRRERRCTYKIMVENIIDGGVAFDSPAAEIKKGPIVKEKVAKLEQKDLLRKKAVEDNQLKKQKQLEERKRLREEREKRFAETQAKRQEEEARRRKQLELKAKLVEEKQEEIRKQREMDEKLKKQVRELKMAELQARRQREEEEKRRKAAELLQEEKRKEEMLQRKADLEEQKRLEMKMKNERAEKERMRQIEEERNCDEERKKREFEEKEKHRNEVSRKKKEALAKERTKWNVLREEKMKQADEVILNAKKVEQTKLQKTNQLKSKINKCNDAKKVASPLRSSPRLLGKENTFKMPSNHLPYIKSPAAYFADNTLAAKSNTPVRESSYVSYDINDLCSDDSSEDEAAPAKRVPSWASGEKLEKQLLQQFYTNVNPEDIFIDCMEPLRLDEIFKLKKKRYFHRTSSAHWTSPPIGFKHTFPIRK